MNMLTADTTTPAPAPITYDTTRTVTLTLGQFLSLHSALFDAIEYNRDRNFPITANDIREVKNALIAQIDSDLAAAAAECRQKLEAIEARKADRAASIRRSQSDAGEPL